MVSERFDMDWPAVLVSSFGAIVVRFDGRGSGFQGTNLLHRVQKKLGLFEERDQLEALRSASVASLVSSLNPETSRGVVGINTFNTNASFSLPDVLER